MTESLVLFSRNELSMVFFHLFLLVISSLIEEKDCSSDNNSFRNVFLSMLRTVACWVSQRQD